MAVREPPHERDSSDGFNLSKCRHCSKPYSIVYSALGYSMDNSGALKWPNLNFSQYIMHTGACVDCTPKGRYDFDIKLVCGGFFVAERYGIDWLLSKWKCPLLVKDPDKMSGDDAGNMERVAPFRPGWMLKEWFKRLSNKDKSTFLGQTEIDEKTLNALFNGRASIDRDFAGRLSRAIGTDEAELWLWMQYNYDEFQRTGHGIDKDYIPHLEQALN